MAESGFLTGRAGEAVVGGITNNGPKHARLDTTTRALAVMEYEHYTIHNNYHYFFTDKFTIGTTDTKEYLLTTPPEPSVHMKFIFEGAAITQFDIFENTTHVAATTDAIPLTSFNSNRNSTDTAGFRIDSPILISGTTDGTLMKTYKGGSAQGQARQGESAKSDEEIVLKRDAKYLIRFSSGTASNLCDIQLLWYELDTYT